MCVLDMATLRVVRGEGSRVEVLARTGELLARLDTELEQGSEPGAVVLEAYDEVLSGATVLRRVDGEIVRCRVALLNPFTNEVALGALPKTEVFRFSGEIPAGGVVLEADADGLTRDGVPLERISMRRDGLVKAAIAHTV